MKTFSQFIVETKLPTNFLYVNTSDLKKYLDAADRILSVEAKTVIKYLIQNPELRGKDLNDILSNKNTEHNEIKDALLKLKKYDRLIEIPVYQSQEQFEAIINQDCTIDELLYDFDSEAGRNKIAKQYESLVHKIAQQKRNSSNLDYDELLSAGYLGLTHAINKYANTDRIAIDEKTGKKKWVAFSKFAAQQIHFYMLEDIKKLSHTVKISQAEQARERAETGSNIKNHTVSGDEIIGTGSNAKTRFDLMTDIPDSEHYSPDISIELYKRLTDILYTAFPKRHRDVNIFIDLFGLKDDKPLKSVEVAKKYNICGSNVTRIAKDFINFIKSEPEAYDIILELNSLCESREPKAMRKAKSKRTSTINESKNKYNICRKYV